MGKTTIVLAARYGILSIKSLSKNGNKHTMHWSNTWPKAVKYLSVYVFIVTIRRKIYIYFVDKKLLLWV